MIQFERPPVPSGNTKKDIEDLYRYLIRLTEEAEYVIGDIEDKARQHL